MKSFKFLQKKPERVFTDYMDQMDDYHLGGIIPWGHQHFRYNGYQFRITYDNTLDFMTVGDVLVIFHNSFVYEPDRYSSSLFEEIKYFFRIFLDSNEEHFKIYLLINDNYETI